jgi:hypothetical protein
MRQEASPLTEATEERAGSEERLAEATLQQSRS